jgi:hypothetical protein
VYRRQRPNQRPGISQYTLILGDSEFIEKERLQLQKASFSAKEREQLSTEYSLKFNGGVIQLHNDGSITLTQERQCQNLKLVTNKIVDSTATVGSLERDSQLEINTLHSALGERI